MKLTVSYEKRVRIHLDTPDWDFTGWATYIWNEKKGLWCCKEANEGFHRKSGLDWEISDRDMTLIALGGTNESQ